MRHTHITALLALSLLAAGNTLAQPASSLHPGSGTAGNAPATSLHGPTSVPATSGQPAQAWSVPAAASKATDVHTTEPSALQKADLPADLAHMNDSAIIVIGGKPTTAGEVKRAVLSLDDKAIIIIGGKHVAAAELKREIAVAGGNKPVAQPAPTGRGKAAAHVLGQSITTFSPRRTAVARQLQAIREDEDRLANAVGNADPKPNLATTPAGTSVWPQAPLGTKVLQTPAGNNMFGIYAVNGRTKNIQLTPGGKVVITGFGLGSASSAQLVGGALEHRPVLMRIDGRTPTRIDAQIPANLRGSPDEQHASMEVRTSTGAVYRFDGVSFIANREEITITDAATIARFVESIRSNSQWEAYGQIGEVRGSSGKSIDCLAPGTDTIHFRKLGGFEAIGVTMVHGRTDSGDDDANGWAGSRVSTGAYTFGDWVDQDLKINWGVFRSHTSPRVYVGDTVSDKGRLEDDPFYGTFLPLAYVVVPWAVIPAFGTPSFPIHKSDPWDVCQSAWALTALTAWGPAGVAP